MARGVRIVENRSTCSRPWFLLFLPFSFPLFVLLDRYDALLSTVSIVLIFFATYVTFYALDVDGTKGLKKNVFP